LGKRCRVDQKRHPVWALLAVHPELFARQGTVIVSWRPHQGQKRGPYFSLQDSAIAAPVRLGAARTVLEFGIKLRENNECSGSARISSGRTQDQSRMGRSRRERTSVASPGRGELPGCGLPEAKKSAFDTQHTWKGQRRAVGGLLEKRNLVDQKGTRSAT
jgi:hypothetical protein